jgi:hypothetical protein
MLIQSTRLLSVYEIAKRTHVVLGSLGLRCRVLSIVTGLARSTITTGHTIGTGHAGRSALRNTASAASSATLATLLASDVLLRENLQQH